MRQTFLVTYDVCCPKRLRRVFRILRGSGDHLQLSVFRCELDAREVIELRTKLEGAIHAGEDQVLFVDVGPVEGRADRAITALGRRYLHPERCAVVV